MSKFFVDLKNIDKENKLILISGEDVNHLKNVLRSAVGDSITVCDGAGYDYIGTISQMSKTEVEVTFTETIKCDTEPVFETVLYQGVAKGERMDQLIQKCVELGISRIVPVLCKRTVVSLKNDKDREAKRVRWQRIAAEAAKQCNRGIIPEVALPVSFAEAVKEVAQLDCGKTLKLIPYENEHKVNLKSVLGKIKEIPKCALFFIGPEGGFDEIEVESAINAGCATLSLGNRILRTETAGPAILSVLQYVFGT